MEMSAQFPVKKLCSVLNVNRSGFYKWKSRLDHPSDRLKSFVSNICLFKEYHAKYPSHGYRWLNAKIRPDTGLIVSDLYAHRCIFQTSYHTFTAKLLHCHGRCHTTYITYSVVVIVTFSMWLLPQLYLLSLFKNFLFTITRYL